MGRELIKDGPGIRGDSPYSNNVWGIGHKDMNREVRVWPLKGGLSAAKNLQTNKQT